jgi:hypothetical protein|tara:strand:- start:561 stop:728 length:168 start_codon:yes stop_codon:yes gene_type:complete
MASRTQETKFKRKTRRKNAGKDSKRVRRQGTTPSFPVHTEAADRNAPDQAKATKA